MGRYIAIGFGFLLCAAMIFVFFYFFSSKRKAKVEQPKYTMLDDNDKDNNSLK